MMKFFYSKRAKPRSRQKSFTHLPYVLSRKTIYILPSRYGLFFIIVLFVMLIASLNYSNNLGFLLIFLLGPMGFISILYTFRNLAGIQILSVKVKPVFAGENIVFTFILRINNIKREAVKLQFPEQKSELFDIFPSMDNRIELSMPTQSRGHYKMLPVIISCVYPFGLFRAWSNINIDLNYFVYPKPLPIQYSFSEFDGAGQGINSINHNMGIDDFYGLKNYQPGDSPKRISWKAFSKGQGVFIKQFSAQSGNIISIDWDLIPEPDQELRLSYMCYMILQCHSNNIEYGMKLPGHIITPDKGEKHHNNCLKALSIFRIKSTVS